EDVFQYNEVRGMYGYTGTYKGERISVQGTGMGVPSISIYVNELIQSYDVKKLIRVGTCGALREDVNVRDIILAQGATTASKQNAFIFQGLHYAPVADVELLKRAYDLTNEQGCTLHRGDVCARYRVYR